MFSFKNIQWKHCQEGGKGASKMLYKLTSIVSIGSWRNKSECLIDGKYRMQNTIYNGTVTVTPSVSQRTYMRIAEGGSKQ